MRLHLICRCCWVRLWLRVNKDLLSPELENALYEKVDNIENNTHKGIYDNIKRGSGFKVF